MIRFQQSDRVLFGSRALGGFSSSSPRRGFSLGHTSSPLNYACIAINHSFKNKVPSDQTLYCRRVRNRAVSVLLQTYADPRQLLPRSSGFSLRDIYRPALTLHFGIATPSLC